MREDLLYSADLYAKEKADLVLSAMYSSSLNNREITNTLYFKPNIIYFCEPKLILAYTKKSVSLQLLI